jgi:hypothetical protein
VRRIRQHLSYANVMSTIAVVLALGGATAFAASTLSRNSVGTKQLRKDAVTGAKVKDGSLSGSDIDTASLGEVPAARRAKAADQAEKADKAERAASAERADRATVAERANTAERSKEADHAANVDRANSAATADFATAAAGLAPPEDLHRIGAPGEPAFSTGWRDLFNGQPPSFYMDREGRVFLQGELEQTTAGTNAMFFLPISYAPAASQFFLSYNGSLTPGVVLVESSGAVRFNGTNARAVFLNGISWRAGK